MQSTQTPDLTPITHDEYLIAIIVFVFSIVFPSLKIFYTAKVWRGVKKDDQSIVPVLSRLEKIGKWSMLDVFVVGLIVFSAKASGIANATPQIGLYFFIAAIGLSLFSVSLVKKVAQRTIINESSTPSR